MKCPTFLILVQYIVIHSSKRKLRFRKNRFKLYLQTTRYTTGKCFWKTTIQEYESSFILWLTTRRIFLFAGALDIAPTAPVAHNRWLWQLAGKSRGNPCNNVTLSTKIPYGLHVGLNPAGRGLTMPYIRMLVYGFSLWRHGSYPRGSPCGICVRQTGIGAGFLRVFCFSLPVCIPPIASCSLVSLSSAIYSLDTVRILK